MIFVDLRQPKTLKYINTSKDTSVFKKTEMQTSIFYDEKQVFFLLCQGQRIIFYLIEMFFSLRPVHTQCDDLKGIREGLNDL